MEYSGGACNDPNLRYYIAFSTVFYMICAVSFVQLVNIFFHIFCSQILISINRFTQILCINSEFGRLKPKSFIRALRITTQKALYFFICLATAIRGFYFSSPTNATLLWAESLMSAYYPVLLSGSSLVVCFWAEVSSLLILKLLLISGIN